VRVLYVSDVYFPRVNGVSTSIATFRKSLRDVGVEVVLVAPRYGDTADDDSSVRRVRSSSVPNDPEDRRMHWRALRREVDRALEARIDLVHVQTPFLAHYAGARGARAAGIPVGTTYHTYFEEYLHHYVPLLPRALGRWSARAFTRSQCAQVDAIVAPTVMMRDALRAYGVTQRIEVVPTGLPSGAFKRGDGAQFRAKLKVAPHRALFLYVGRVAFEKNIDFLLRAFAQVRRARPDAVLLIAGEGPALGELRRLAAALHIQDAVIFVGYLDRATELLDCYAAADVFVFASRTETQGLVLLEAMAQGTPVVSLAELGTKAILTADSGAIVAREDEVAFAESSLEALHLGRNLARRARLRAHAERWSSASTAAQLADLYRSMLERTTLQYAAAR
jgi:glycosyltransferase involved in cell wall biosynthesis